MGLLDDTNAAIDSSFAVHDNIKDLKAQQDLDSLNALAKEKALKDSMALSPNSLAEAFLSNKSGLPLGTKSDFTNLIETLTPGTNLEKEKKESHHLFYDYIAKNIVHSAVQYANPERKGGNIHQNDLITYSKRTPDAVEMGNLKQIFLKKTLRHINLDSPHWAQQVPILGALAFDKTLGFKASKGNVPWVEGEFDSMNGYIESVNKVRELEGHEPIGLLDKDGVMKYYLDMVQNNKMRGYEIKNAKIQGDFAKMDSLRSTTISMDDLYANFIPKTELGGSYTDNGKSMNDNWFNAGHGSEYGSVPKDNIDVVPGSIKTFNASTVDNVDWLDPNNLVQLKYKNFSWLDKK